MSPTNVDKDGVRGRGPAGETPESFGLTRSAILASSTSVPVGRGKSGGPSVGAKPEPPKDKL